VLKNGIPGELGGQQAYRFSGDAFEIFENFFGTGNPHTIALDCDGKQVQLVEKIENDIHKDAVTGRVNTHAADLEIECQATLEEFFYGSTKMVPYTCKKLGEGGMSNFEDCWREIEIKPGMKNGTRLFFGGEGSRPENKLQGDLIITIKQIVHDKYHREGNNLIYRHKISLLDALQTAPFEFKTLDGELFCITPDEIVSSSTQKVFKGKGMPILNDDPLSPLMPMKPCGDFIL